MDLLRLSRRDGQRLAYDQQADGVVAHFLRQLIEPGDGDGQRLPAHRDLLRQPGHRPSGVERDQQQLGLGLRGVPQRLRQIRTASAGLGADVLPAAGDVTQPAVHGAEFGSTRAQRQSRKRVVLGQLVHHAS
ncbi:hypothetical protein [Actinomadura sp. 3N407]|uniref:hypothetical protein n=1 Tax=Actinomadura sp. 3N407 TaxID=3457423 RepID=UPI003FCE69A6